MSVFKVKVAKLASYSNRILTDPLSQLVLVSVLDFQDTEVSLSLQTRIAIAFTEEVS